MMLSEAGRAMARHKEQKAFNEWLTHGHIVFDNELRKQDPVKWAEAGTTGLDYLGNYNDTLAVEDLLDLIIAVYNNEYTPTDLVMHPLAWTAFAKNGLTGGLAAPYDREAKREVPSGSFKLGPESIQGRLPFAFNVNLSPFAPIDKVEKKFDIFFQWDYTGNKQEVFPMDFAEYFPIWEKLSPEQQTRIRSGNCRRHCSR